MPCSSPIPIWRGSVLDSGKREILFKPSKVQRAGLSQEKIPCGRCSECRLERSRQWAMRCLHESSTHDLNSFLTLTYAEDKLPPNGSLVKRDFQLFMKRLRKFADVPAPGLRFFACGEYGEKLGRPHYHAIIFNYDFPDKKFHKNTAIGDTLWTSNILSKLWPAGYSLIGSVTFESAAYVARYVMKKINVSEKTPDNIKRAWEDKYVNKLTGEIREPEFVLMSRRPGIGKNFFLKYKSEMFPRDFAIMRGMKMRPPRYYSGMYELTNPEDFACVKRKRRGKMCGLIGCKCPICIEASDERLLVRAEVKAAQMRSLSRNLEV